MIDSDQCDHTSVGIIVRDRDQILMIERVKPPLGFAPPAGHVDHHSSFEQAARAELLEEVGLTVDKIRLLSEGKLANNCRRRNGSWHYWKVYEAEASGMQLPNPEEAKSIRYMRVNEIEELVTNTLENLPGQKIDPAWIYWFMKLEIISKRNYFFDNLPSFL